MFHIYLSFSRILFQMHFQYRANQVIWAIGTVVEPLVYLVVWTATANGSSLAGYGAGEFAAYYIVLLIVQQFTATWEMWSFDYLIRSGKFSLELLRPLHPIHQYIVNNMTEKAFKLVAMIPALILLVALFEPVFAITWWSTVLFIPSLALAAILAFMLGWIVALAAFWTIRIQAINLVYFLLMLFFSGRLAPLDLLPEVLQSIADVLPFKWIIGFPIELMIGRVAPEAAMQGLGIQMLWIGAVFILMQWLWRISIRRYGAVGG